MNLNKLYGLIFVIIILIIFSFVSLNASTITGLKQGEFTVNKGTSYNLKILTPKGTSGLKPNLSISYNLSNTSTGLLGVGFSLNGLSQISKCNSSKKAYYCLDGQDLILENNKSYKTNIDIDSKILKDSSGWTVYKKDGLTYEYGKTSDSRDLDVSYRLNKIKDRNKNEINFIYDISLKTISKIIYGNNIIIFNYENNKTKDIKLGLNKILKDIKVKIGSTQIVKYSLSYEYKNNKSHLNQITECWTCN